MKRMEHLASCAQLAQPKKGNAAVSPEMNLSLRHFPHTKKHKSVSVLMQIRSFSVYPSITSSSIITANPVTIPIVAT